MTAYIPITLKELLRKRVFLVTLVLSLCYLGFFGFGTERMFHWDKPGESGLAESYLVSVTLLYLGFFFGQFIVAFFAFFSTMGTISGEQESGLLLAVLARPIPRWRLYLSKWLGHAVWLVVYSSIIFVSIIAIVHGFGRFPLDFVVLLRSYLLFIWMPLLLLSLSMLGSVYLSTLGNGIACALLFAFALFSGMLEGIMKQGSFSAAAGIEKFNLIISLIIPTDGVFRRMAYELIDGSHLPWMSMSKMNLGPFSGSNIPSAAFIVYTLLYCTCLVFLGCKAFAAKDV